MMERFLNDRSDWLQYRMSLGGSDQELGQDAEPAKK